MLVSNGSKCPIEPYNVENWWIKELLAATITNYCYHRIKPKMYRPFQLFTVILYLWKVLDSKKWSG